MHTFSEGEAMKLSTFCLIACENTNPLNAWAVPAAGTGIGEVTLFR
jgi:hypothetical protein